MIKPYKNNRFAVIKNGICQLIVVFRAVLKLVIILAQFPSIVTFIDKSVILSLTNTVSQGWRPKPAKWGTACKYPPVDLGLLIIPRGVRGVDISMLIDA